MKTIFKNRFQDLKLIFLVNLLISFFYWLIFHPGLFSSDSFAAYEMAKSGNLSNSFTASWAIYVRYFSLFGNGISILTLLNVSMLTYAVTRLCTTLFEKRVAMVVAFVMCLTPGVSGIGITLWHDIPMTAGFLLLISSIVRIEKYGAKNENAWLELALGSVLVTFRPNGLPTLALVFISAIASRQLRNFARPLAVSLVIGGVTTLLTSYVFIGEPPINKVFAQEWMRNDISCYAANTDKSNFERVTTISKALYDDWKSPEACVFLNRFSLSEAQRKRTISYVPHSWLRLVKDEPMFVLKTHLERNAYLNPIPIYGIPKPPFLHTNIEFQDKGVVSTFKSLSKKLRLILRAWNFLKPVTAWVGLWLAIIALVYMNERKKQYALLFVFVISLVLILFIVAPIPDGRYGLLVLIAGQILLLGKIATSYLGMGENNGNQS